ncbi:MULTISPECIES: inositol-3-phosphate synthase [unclassified Burkholderia]|uniref:inositol-3-phosphate synthase n=1 Tax=unclassified Burkholderia TaxID=2613784 RepID=UPI0007526379|nr:MULTISPECIES: inositol-3-phosphate synthase [unclassified Burkholderia]KVN03119.1 myo-inositol-1-phosphate synthase [Burkholderia sp. MSMB1552]KWZ49778.1 myo-inositol-1-phosphate synthase [Burkholderia sp. MSMB1588]
MAQRIRLAVAGVGNNISALFQGVEYYRALRDRGVDEREFVGVKRPRIGGIGVSDVEFVAAFDIHPNKVSRPFDEAVLAPPNNYPMLGVPLPAITVPVDQGLTSESAGDGDAAFEHVVRRLRESEAEVLLYSLPTGLQWAAEAYARAALAAGVAFVNCTPELVARTPALLDAYQAAGVPLVGDDLASHFGTSVVHRALLGLLSDRGITLQSSYQLNFGGNEDFRNLRERGASKQQSKLNALAQDGVDTSRVEVIPSAGYIGQLKDNKVAIVNIEGVGWGGTPVQLDLKLKVQDSSNAAGVIIDLIRIAAASRRAKLAGFPAAAAKLLKSPVGGHDKITPQSIDASFRALDAAPVRA